MKFFDCVAAQVPKKGMTVCGDVYKCEKNEGGTLFVLCDGIGSGVYANIAAIGCAERIVELFNRGVSLNKVAQMIASSMHAARTKDIPFSAFTAVRILPDGQFKLYTYESPAPVYVSRGLIKVLTPRYFTAGYEAVGECEGKLQKGDSLFVFSDGVTHAGLGNGFKMGIEEKGLSEYIKKLIENREKLHIFPQKVLEMCKNVSGGNYDDDITFALINCRTAKKTTILSGPPSHREKDSEYVNKFMSATGAKVICGSTTTDIVARELGRQVQLIDAKRTFDSPPEYFIEGIDITAEGAITLNQVYNILGEMPESLGDLNVVERLCKLLLSSDVVEFMSGEALNDAHTMLTFKQLGIRPRKATIELIAEKLKEMGKLVSIKYY